MNSINRNPSIFILGTSMKPISLIILFAAFNFNIAHANTEVDQSYNRLLDSIVMVENVPHYSFIGKNGERSPYQITNYVWAEYSHLTFFTASKVDSESKKTTRLIALQHLKWIAQEIDNPTVYRMALAWNAGKTAVKRNRFTRAQKSYAQRVENIYVEKLKNKLSENP